MPTQKIAHFHLKDYMGNRFTLICELVDGSIKYTFYSGHGSSGTSNSLSNLQCTLPVYPEPGETKERFADRLEEIINQESVKYVDRRVPIQVEFAK